MSGKILHNIQSVIHTMEEHGVILCQTDTVPGLLCDAHNKNALEKIMHIKQRTNSIFAIFVTSLEMAYRYAKINEVQAVIFNKVFPGYFTLILEASKYAIQTLPSSIFGIKNDIKTIGIRVPNSTICRNFVMQLDRAIAATSANLSSHQTPQTIHEVSANITTHVDGVFYNNNSIGTGESSSIIDIIDPNNIEIIRYGSGDINTLISNAKK